MIRTLRTGRERGRQATTPEATGHLSAPHGPLLPGQPSSTRRAAAFQPPLPYLVGPLDPLHVRKVDLRNRSPEGGSDPAQPSWEPGRRPGYAGRIPFPPGSAPTPRRPGRLSRPPPPHPPARTLRGRATLGPRTDARGSEAPHTAALGRPTPILLLPASSFHRPTPQRAGGRAGLAPTPLLVQIGPAHPGTGAAPNLVTLRACKFRSC